MISAHALSKDFTSLLLKVILKKEMRGHAHRIEGSRRRKKKKSGLPDSLDFFMDFLSLGLFLFDICHVDYDFNLL
jgi:hypothetical protein